VDSVNWTETFSRVFSSGRECSALSKTDPPRGAPTEREEWLTQWELGDVGPIVIGLLDVAPDVVLKELLGLRVVIDVELAVIDHDVFVRAAETGSFSKVAREFNISQLSVSRMVASLERRLGVKLLLRTTRQVTAITSAGRLKAEPRKI
jgi:hypothetical protein